MDNGYIMVARKLLNNPIMNKPPDYLKVWMYLLLKANFADTKSLKRGEGRTSINEIIDYLSYNKGYVKVTPSKKQVWGIIEWLRNPHEGYDEGNNEGTMIVTTKVTHGFVYKVLKYDVYQSSEFYEGNNEGNDEIRTKELRRERQGNNVNKKDKEGEEKQINIDDFFESIWSLYPNKKGKSAISKTTKGKLYKVGFDKLESAIAKYKKELSIDSWKKTMNGSTFFNGRYLDYLQEESKTATQPITPKVIKTEYIDRDGKTVEG